MDIISQMLEGVRFEWQAWVYQSGWRMLGSYLDANAAHEAAMAVWDSETMDMKIVCVTVKR